MATAAEIAERIGARKAGTSFIARCPVPGHGKGRGDRDASLSISEGAGGKVLLHCHAGCSFEAVAEAVGLDKPSSFPAKTKSPSPAPMQPQGIPDVIYDYVDEGGELLYQVLRYGHGTGKTFKYRRPDGTGRWIWNLDGVRRVPYQLPEVLKADAILIVEGEKDCDALVGLGYFATNSKNWRKEWTEFFTGKTIFIIPDKDEPGRKTAHSVATSLDGTAKAVHILELPADLPPGGDVSDLISMKGGDGADEELTRLITEAPSTRLETPFGSPAPIGVWLDTEPPPIDYLFENLLIKGIVGGIFAQGGTGKTYLIVCLMLSAALGLRSFSTFRPTRSMRVLGLLGEDPPGMIHRRVRSILGEFGDIDKAMLVDNLRLYCGSPGPLMKLDGNNPTRADAFEWLKGEVEDFRPELVVIDPKSMFYGLDENSNDHCTQWVNTLKALTLNGATVLFSHHVTKALSGALELTGARGGSSLVDGSRFAANMRHLTEDDAKKYDIDEPWRYVEFKVTKNSYVPKLPGSVFFRFTQDGALEEVDLKATRESAMVDELIAALNTEAADGNFYTVREAARSKALLPDATERDRNHAVELAIKSGRLTTEMTTGKGRPKVALVSDKGLSAKAAQNDFAES